MYKGSGSESCDAKWRNYTCHGTLETGIIGSISPIIRGLLEEAQKNTLCGGRTQRETTMGSAPFLGGDSLLSRPEWSFNCRDGTKIVLAVSFGQWWRWVVVS